MKWLCLILLFLSAFGFHRFNQERHTLQDRLSQQQYQIEVLVSRFNDKQPGEWAELLPDGTVSYWRSNLQDTTHIVRTVVVYDTLTIVVEGYRRGHEFYATDTLRPNWRVRR